MLINCVSCVTALPAGKSRSNALICGAGGPKFKSRAGQIESSEANGLPPLRHFFERSCVAWAQGPTNSSHASA